LVVYRVNDCDPPVRKHVAQQRRPKRYRSREKPPELKRHLPFAYANRNSSAFSISAVLGGNGIVCPIDLLGSSTQCVNLESPASSRQQSAVGKAG